MLVSSLAKSLRVKQVYEHASNADKCEPSVSMKDLSIVLQSS
jgi:hypothetical protein